MDGREIRLITFRVGGESFVLDIMSVRQIVPYEGSTPVPLAPEFLEGIIVLRNEVIPIIDLRHRLFPGKETASQQPLVLITSSDDGQIGLKVDEVRRILTINLDSILPPPPIVRGLQGELFIGVIEAQGEIHLLLDLPTLLTPEERRRLAEPQVREAMSDAAKEAAGV